MKEFWNDRYASSEYVYGDKPNAFFKQQLDILEPKKLLLPLEGEGRNAVYAASKGWFVDAFDFSEQGRNKAMHLARENNVTFNYTLLKAQDFKPKPQTYNVISLIYAHFPPELRSEFHKKLVVALKTDGIVILEAFNKNQIHNNTGGPPNINLLYSKDQLQEDFKDLDIEILQELPINIDEGLFHQGTAEVIRLIARKHKA